MLSNVRQKGTYLLRHHDYGSFLGALGLQEGATHLSRVAQGGFPEELHGKEAMEGSGLPGRGQQSSLPPRHAPFAEKGEKGKMCC